MAPRCNSVLKPERKLIGTWNKMREVQVWSKLEHGGQYGLGVLQGLFQYFATKATPNSMEMLCQLCKDSVTRDLQQVSLTI